MRKSLLNSLIPSRKKMNKSKPKIAIVHDFLIKLGGAEKVLEVLHEMYPDAPIYTILYDESGTRGVFDKKEYNIMPAKILRLHSQAIQTLALEIPIRD